MTPEHVREISRAAGPDVLSDTAGGAEAEWLYAPGDYARATLARLVREGFRANRHVHYATNFAAPSATVRFAVLLSGGPVKLRICGTATLEVDGERFEPAHASETVSTPADVVRVAPPAGARDLAVVVTAAAGEAAAISVVTGPRADAWTAVGVPGPPEVDTESPTPADIRRGAPQTPPHRTGEPVQRLELTRDDGLIDLGVPVLGHPVVFSDAAPVIRTGESREEALSTAVHESRHDVVRRQDGAWTTEHALGFRYLTLPEGVDAHVEAHVRPAHRRGAFASSDETLNRVWATSAYTLRASMQRLTVDGIKRDRMPWVGDQALALLSNAYAFGDPQILVDGLEALGSPVTGYANGISDYSLWWVIAARMMRRFHGVSSVRLTTTAERIVQSLAAMCDDDGVLRPRSFDSDFADSAAGAVFIDWGMRVDAEQMPTALQLLWHWALRSVAELTGTVEWAQFADRVRRTLFARAWDPQRRRWNKNLDDSSEACPYADAFAVLGGISQGDTSHSAGFTLDDARLMGTPFMAAFGLLALHEAGAAQDVVAGIRERWVPMLEHGASTFWEEGVGDGSPWAMYGRAFGKSLCHGWASGPAFLLPIAVLGIEPLEDGWQEVRVAPALGGLKWAAGVVPTPRGDLFVEAGPNGVRIEAPTSMGVVAPEGAHVIRR